MLAFIGFVMSAQASVLFSIPLPQTSLLSAKQTVSV